VRKTQGRGKKLSHLRSCHGTALKGKPMTTIATLTGLPESTDTGLYARFTAAHPRTVPLVVN